MPSMEATDTFPNIRDVSSTTALALPYEMWVQIFSCSSRAHLQQINLACKDWCQLARGPQLKRPDVIQLKVWKLSTLSVLNNLLPKLEQLDLTTCYPQTGETADLNQFLKLKALSMPSCCVGLLQPQTWSSLTQMLKIHLEKLIMNIDPYVGDYLNVLAANVSSLRWLRIQFRFRRGADLTLRDNFRETFKMFTQLEHRVRATVCKSDCLQSLELWSGDVTETIIKQLNLLSGKIRRLVLCDDIESNPQDFIDGINRKTSKTLTQLKFSVLSLTRDDFCGLIRRLPNLISLDVMGSEIIITDQVMGYVFRYLIHLRHLALPACVSEDDIEQFCSGRKIITITNLKKLHTLKSCFCPIRIFLISNKNVKFYVLIELKLLACLRTRKMSVPRHADMSDNFPAFAELFLHFETDSDDIQEMLNINPRLWFKLNYFIDEN
uniref:F-box domain-containing protein n=1 Tax=Glossina pallidipes TaxID=7398 RepID=A0A1A9ZCV1_GLOPL